MIYICMVYLYRQDFSDPAVTSTMSRSLWLDTIRSGVDLLAIVDIIWYHHIYIYIYDDTELKVKQYMYWVIFIL